MPLRTQVDELLRNGQEARRLFQTLAVTAQRTEDEIERLRTVTTQLQDSAAAAVTSIEPAVQSIREDITQRQRHIEQSAEAATAAFDGLQSSTERQTNDVQSALQRVSEGNSQVQQAYDELKTAMESERAAWSQQTQESLTRMRTAEERLNRTVDALLQALETLDTTLGEVSNAETARVNDVEAGLRQAGDELTEVIGSWRTRLEGLGDAYDGALQSTLTAFVSQPLESLEGAIESSLKKDRAILDEATGALVENGIRGMAATSHQVAQELAAPSLELERITRDIGRGPKLRNLLEAGRPVLATIGKAHLLDHLEG